jgi:hypothetical protein
MHSETNCSAKLSSVKLDGLVSETRWSRISRNSNESSKMTTTDPDDWRTPWYIILRALVIMLIEKFSSRL